MNRFFIGGFSAWLALTMACTHTAQKQSPAVKAGTETSVMPSRLDRQWFLFHDAMSAVPGEKLTRKQRQQKEQALERLMVTDLQSKRFQTGSYEKSIFETRTVQETKTFSTKDFPTRNLGLREKPFPTSTLAMPSFETKNYSLPDNPGYETREFGTNKLGLRAFTEAEGRRITGRTQASSQLVRQKLGKPTKGTQVIDPTSIFRDEGTSGSSAPNLSSSEKPAPKKQ